MRSTAPTVRRLTARAGRRPRHRHDGGHPARSPACATPSPWDNRSVTAAKEIPRRLLVLGGGAVGAEMAQALRRLGAEEVTVVEAGDRLLAREEPFAGDEVQAAFEAEGITVAHRRQAGRRLRRRRRRHRARSTTAATIDRRRDPRGRRPPPDHRRHRPGDRRPGAGPLVEVDDQLRASGVAGGWLYAVGDCNGRALLTHMGKYQARLAGDVILGKDAPTGPPRRVPR